MAKKFADDILENPQKVLDAVRGGEIDPNAKEKGIPIISAAINNNDLDLIAELIERGADVNAYATRPAAERGMAPIHFAKSPEAVALLAQAKVEIDAVYKSVDHAWGMRGETKLHSAAISGDVKLAQALKAAGANADIPFSKTEYEYATDSHVALPDRVTRGTQTINQRLQAAQIAIDPKSSPDYIDPVALQAVAARREKENAAAIAELQINKIELVVGPEKVLSSAANSWASKVQPKEPVVAPSDLLSGKDNSVESDEIFKSSAKQGELPLPDSVKNYYLQVGKKFYQPNNKDLVAFEDKGSELHTKSDSPNIAKSLVSIAQSRGWDEIKSTGSETFRRAVWMEAAKLGIHDRGYKPTEIELAELAKIIPKNKVEKVTESQRFRGGENTPQAKPENDPQKSQADSNATAKPTPAVNAPKQETPADAERKSAAESASVVGGSKETNAPVSVKTGLDAADDRHARQEQAVQAAMAKAAARRAEKESAQPGEQVAPKAETLVAHGAAPYMNDKDNSPSYFVTTKDAQGNERTRWGVDLHRAVSQAGANVGDEISFAKAVDKHVVVNQNVRDESGEVVGKKTIDTIRNKWDIEVAEAFRNNSIEQVVKDYPQMAGAAAILAASEKHASELAPNERKAVLNMVRENMAREIEKGVIPTANIREEKEVKRERTKEQQQNQEQERSM